MENFRKLLVILIILSPISYCFSQKTAWFVDGYHGGVYGHFPKWKTKFMIDMLKEQPNWKINLEIEPETWDSVKHYDPAALKMFTDYYAHTGKNGRIEFVNPNFAQPYCYNVSGESIIRQFFYGIAKTKEHFPDAVFTTYSCEEPCFTSSLPAILKGFGFKYGVLRNPNTCWGGYTSPFGKDLVNWIGPDGTSMIAVPRYACEGLVKESTWQTDSWTNSNEFIETCFANGIKYAVGMCFQDAGWKGGPWKNEYQPTEYALWTDYIEMVKDKVVIDDWKFTIEDVKPGLVWGAYVLQKLAQEVRISENLLVTAEKMASLNFLLNSIQWQDEQFAEAWKTLMLAQHHDCWIVPYNHLKSRKNWAEWVTIWTNASNKIAQQQIEMLPINIKKDNSNQEKSIVVFNTLGTTREEIVTVEIPSGFDIEEYSLSDLNGNNIESQVSKRNGKVFLNFKASVPGFGYSTYLIEKKKTEKKQIHCETVDNGKLKIDNRYYTIVIDPKKGGTISSIIAKEAGNIELVQEGKAFNNLRGHLYEENKFYEGADNEAKVSIIENGNLFIKIKIENSFVKNNYEQYITVYNQTPLIDFELHINWTNPKGIGAYDNDKNYRNEDYAKAFYNDEYKLHLRFPFNGIGDKLFKNAPFDVCESKLDNTIYSTWDSIKHNVILNWVDVTNNSKNFGVALFSDHTTSYLQTNDLPLGLTVQYIGKALWGRNYIPHGPTKIKYSLLPHNNDWMEAGVQAASDSWNEPLSGHLIEGIPERNTFSFMEIQGKGLELSSMTVNGNDLYVRLFNSSNNSEHPIIFKCTAQKVELVDLNGNTIAPIQMKYEKNGLHGVINIPQFGFQTIKLSQPKIL